jgi:hypothetical protein
VQAVLIVKGGLSVEESETADLDLIAEVLDQINQRDTFVLSIVRWALAHLLNVSGKTLKKDVSPEKLLKLPKDKKKVKELKKIWRHRRK